MSLSVRPMQSDDIDGVYAIELAAHRAPWSREILSDCVFVAYDCRVLEETHATEVPTLAGYIIARYTDTTCHVLNLCIAPSLQGKGYGHLILQNMLDSLPNTAIDTVLLEVRPSNASALHLYKKMGFQKTGIKRGYYRDPEGIEDAIILQKSL